MGPFFGKKTAATYPQVRGDVSLWFEDRLFLTRYVKGKHRLVIWYVLGQGQKARRIITVLVSCHAIDIVGWQHLHCSSTSFFFRSILGRIPNKKHWADEEILFPPWSGRPWPRCRQRFESLIESYPAMLTEPWDRTVSHWLREPIIHGNRKGYYATGICYTLCSKGHEAQTQNYCYPFLSSLRCTLKLTYST